MFNTRMPKKPRFVKGGFPPRKSKAKSIVGRLYDKAMENTYSTLEGRKPEYRPSAFPLCSVLLYRKMVKGASVGYFEEKRSAAGDYFTSIGTQAHENIQFHMGFSGKIFGDWKCRNMKCSKGLKGRTLFDKEGNVVHKGRLTSRNTTVHKCPKCDRAMEYVEKEIRYKGLKGHIDCIVKLDNGMFWVADYKTCTKNKLDSNKLPERAHLKQLPAYCWVLQKKYKMKIAGFSLLYFSRDNPFNYLEHAEDWTEEWNDKCGRMIAQERAKFKAGVDSFISMDHTEAVKNKPCTSLAFYKKEIAFYTECPLLDVCFDKKKLDASLTQHVIEFPSKAKDRKLIIEAINI